MIDTKTATVKELVEFHNKHADKPVKKFANAATARKRVDALIKAKGLDGAKAKKAKAPKAPRTPAVPEETVKRRSAAAANSWSDPSVRAKRTKRHKVKVAGKGEFVSVRKAFEELNLPLSKHIRFRKDLVAEGKATIDGFRFSLAA
jgi:hypothetical protein